MWKFKTDRLGNINPAVQRRIELIDQLREREKIDRQSNVEDRFCEKCAR